MKKKRLSQARRIKAILFSLLFVSFTVAHSQGLQRIPLYIKAKEIRVELAKTPEERAIGLMNRKQLEKDEGMFFIFESEGYHSFWMKNTLLPLSIAFIDKDRRIVDIKDMKPLTLDSHSPSRQVVYALEMNKGWFAANGVRVGDVVRFSR